MLIVLIPSLHDFQLFNEKMYLIYKLAIIIFQIILQKCEWLWYVCERGINFLFVHLSASLGVLSWCNFRKFQSCRQISKICSFHFIAKIQTILFPHYNNPHILDNLNLDLSWSNFVLSNLIKKNTANLFRIQQYGCLYTLHQVSSVSRSVWRWVITDHTAHSFEGLEHRE